MPTSLTGAARRARRACDVEARAGDGVVRVYMFIVGQAVRGQPADG
jgi:hypothetical protein